MALATRCPNCGALFRVGAEQLRSRNGMVRCGSCREVFNAIGRLDYVDPGTVSTTAQIAKPAAAAAPGDSSAIRPIEPTPKETRGDEAHVVAPAVEAGDTLEAEAEGGYETIFAITQSEDPEEDLLTADDEEAPVFLRQPPARNRHAVRLALACGSVLLSVLLVLQTALLYRADLLARVPEFRPVLKTLCNALACEVQWPMRPEFLAVVSSDLQAIPGVSALELNAVIRNRADFPMALPAIELTLTNTLSNIVGRRVILPAEYLATSPTGAHIENLGPGADMSLHLLFQAPEPNVSGFVAYPFYP